MIKNRNPKIINSTPIINYIRENNLTRQRFCDKCHISLKTLSRVLFGDDENVSTSTLIAIADVMKVRIDDLLNKR